MLQERDSAAFKRTTILVQVCAIVTVTGCVFSNPVKELAIDPVHVPRRSGTLISRKILRNRHRQSQLSKAQLETPKTTAMDGTGSSHRMGRRSEGMNAVAIPDTRALAMKRILTTRTRSRESIA